MLSEQVPVDVVILVLENIEYHLDVAVCYFPIIPYRLYGDLRRPFLREAEYTCGDAAEGNAPDSVFFRQFHTGSIAGGEKLFMLLCKTKKAFRTRKMGIGLAFLPVASLSNLEIHKVFLRFAASLQSEKSAPACTTYFCTVPYVHVHKA